YQPEVAQRLADGRETGRCQMLPNQPMTVEHHGQLFRPAWEARRQLLETDLLAALLTHADLLVDQTQSLLGPLQQLGLAVQEVLGRGPLAARPRCRHLGSQAFTGSRCLLAHGPTSRSRASRLDRIPRMRRTLPSFSPVRAATSPVKAPSRFRWRISRCWAGQR